MELKDNLAIRLRALMDQRPDLDVQKKIHKKTGLSQSTIQRILARQVHTSLDIVEKLGKAFGVNPLDLIKPIADIESDSYAIAPNYEELELLKVWRKLPQISQHQAMAFMSVSAQTQIRHDAKARQIDVDLIQQVPAKLVAASEKASGRKPTSESRVEVKNERASKTDRKGRAS